MKPNILSKINNLLVITLCYSFILPTLTGCYLQKQLEKTDASFQEIKDIGNILGSSKFKADGLIDSNQIAVENISYTITEVEENYNQLVSDISISVNKISRIRKEKPINRKGLKEELIQISKFNSNIKELKLWVIVLERILEEIEKIPNHNFKSDEIGFEKTKSELNDVGIKIINDFAEKIADIEYDLQKNIMLLASSSEYTGLGIRIPKLITVFKVLGYTDNKGTRASNQSLSEERADTVKKGFQDYLVNERKLKNINGEALGRGETIPFNYNPDYDEPIIDGVNERNDKNRRISIISIAFDIE